MRISPLHVHVPVQCAGSEARTSACRAARVVSRAPESRAWVTAALTTGHSGPPAPERKTLRGQNPSSNKECQYNLQQQHKSHCIRTVVLNRGPGATRGLDKLPRVVIYIFLVLPSSKIFDQVEIVSVGGPSNIVVDNVGTLKSKRLRKSTVLEELEQHFSVNAAVRFPPIGSRKIGIVRDFTERLGLLRFV